MVHGAEGVEFSCFCELGIWGKFWSVLSPAAFSFPSCEQGTHRIPTEARPASDLQTFGPALCHLTMRSHALYIAWLYFVFTYCWQVWAIKIVSVDRNLSFLKKLSPLEILLFNVKGLSTSELALIIRLVVLNDLGLYHNRIV